jgi:putative RNA 2'-phosphotransferase
VSRQHQFRTDDLAGILSYALGHRPDEFGLVPDSDGFVPVKRLLQALREEPEWSHVREGLLREVLVSEKRELFECRGPLIRARARRFSLDLENPSSPPSGLVFSPIRRRAHPHVLEHGLEPRPDGPHILTADRDTAARIGRRTDPAPVILEIHVPSHGDGAVPLYAFGDLFLAPEIPSEDIVGPPLGREHRKEIERAEKAGRKEETRTPRDRGFESGTFLLEADRDPDPLRRAARGRKRRTWKENARKTRREK